MYADKLSESQQDASALKFALQDEIGAAESMGPSDEKAKSIMTRLRKLGVVKE